MITICADATKCYDRVAHPFTSSYAQYYELGISYLVVLFKAIQSMKILLRMSFEILNPSIQKLKGNHFKVQFKGVE